MNKENNSVVFFGTDEIGACVLKSLINLKANVIAVVTRADKPVGRKKEIVIGEVKQIAIDNNIKVFQPEKLNDLVDELKQLNPDLILTCSYGKIIPESILNLPKLFCVNIHPSLLPKYRGASPIQSAILNNEKITGVSFIFVTKELDEGDILFQEPINLLSNETTYSLKQKVKDKINQMMDDHYHELFNKDIKHTKQDNLQATYVSIIHDNEEVIDWNNSAINIDAKVRSLYDKPIAHTIYNDMRIKIYQTIVTNIHSNNAVAGTIVNIDKTGILVATKDNLIKITKLQIPGKKPIEVSQLINGNHIFKIGNKFN